MASSSPEGDPTASTGFRRTRAEATRLTSLPRAADPGRFRYVSFVMADEQTEKGIYVPNPKVMADINTLVEEMSRAGFFLGAGGLLPSASGARVRYFGRKRTIVDGPFAEAKELIAGFYLIDVRSRDEAVAWASRCPVHLAVPAGVAAEIEVRQVAEMAELSEATDEQRDAEHRLREGYTVG